MTVITARLDLGLYSKDAVIAAAHRFTGTHAVRVEREDAVAIVTLTPRDAGAPAIETAFFDAVVDETLRERVQARTGALHDILVAAAFAPLGGVRP